MLTLIIALVTSQFFAPLMRDTNSAAEVRRGIAQYQKKQHEEALKSFASASKIKPNPLTAYNLGTAHVAAGEFAEGSELLTKALEDEGLRPDAHYNRGNSALSANAVDAAIRDYVSTLKLSPSDREAKRNLEIALLRKQASQRPRPQPRQQPSPQDQQQSPEEQPAPDQDQGEQKEQTDAEALLRSVEQQEREELSRMHRARADRRRIGW